MKLAIFLPNWVGDSCMAIPTLRALREGHSRRTQFIGVARPGPAALLADQPWIDDWLVYKSHASRPLLNRRGLVSALRRHKCDAAILLTNSIGSAAMAAVSGIPRRIGYARDARAWLLTDRLPVLTCQGRPRPIPAIDYYLQIADYLGCPSIERQMELSVGPQFQEQASLLWKAIGFGEQRPTVVINNNAANNRERLWPTAYVERLAMKLVRNDDIQVLLHCSPGEADDANRLARRLNHPRIQSMGHFDRLPMGLSQAVFERAATVVTTDSGARHLAIAMDRPVISLFGPTDPAWTTTYNLPETILRAETPCNRCQKRSKHKNGSAKDCQCMYAIKPERVFIEILNQLKRRPSTLAA